MKHMANKPDDGHRKSLFGWGKRADPPKPSLKPLKPPAPASPQPEQSSRGKLLFAPRKPKPPVRTFKPLKPGAAVPSAPQVKPLSRREKWRLRMQRLRAPIKSFTLVGAGIVIAVGALFAFSVINPGPPRLTPQDVNSAIARAMASATPPPSYASMVYQQVQFSIVHINVKLLDDKGTSQNAHGTGFVLDQRGSILTSLHVVKTATDIKVIFYDGTESSATIAGTEPDKDIALLRTIKAPAQLIPATLGNPRSVRPGDEAIVVGDPFGLANTVTAGSISGLDRSFMPPNSNAPLTGLIQFDAAVNPGNSGGPLLNRAGEVIGVVTGLVNPTGQDVFVGIGFAVPIDVAAGAAGSAPY
jgi:S1-C subfamily serine protease